MATGLDVKLLRMLAAIDRHGTLTRAAGVLGITQSALSHHIKESERRMAVEIFHRVGKRLRFTAIGEELLQAARVVTGEIDRVEGDLALFRQGYGPIVRLGSGAYGCEAGCRTSSPSSAAAKPASPSRSCIPASSSRR